MKKNKKGVLIIIIFVLVIAILLSIKQQKYQQQQNYQKQQNINILKNIKSHFNEYIKTNKITNLYDKDENIIGKINTNISLILEKSIITTDTKYFKLQEFENTYIKYDDVIPSKKENKSDRYKNYIPYNLNIKTKSTTNFYDEFNNLKYSLNKSFDMPIIVKGNDYYGVSFNDELLYIKKDDVKEIYEHHNSKLLNTNGVAVLNYHAFFDENNIEEKKKCISTICMSKSQFQSELDYFKKINIFTITMSELEMYMDGKIQLPKSVLITIDDGGMTKIAVDLLTEYKMNATIFLITSRFNPDEYYKTDYIELHSHSHNLHSPGICPGGQGAGIKCLQEDIILKDLETSRNLLNNTKAFCYPFYEYNEYSTRLLKKAGFSMAFIGEVNTTYGYKLAESNGDKYHIPRFVMFNYTTINDLEEYFNEIK